MIWQLCIYCFLTNSVQAASFSMFGALKNHINKWTCGLPIQYEWYILFSPNQLLNIISLKNTSTSY